MTTPNLYHVLGVDPGASNAELRSAYARLVKLHHPDTVGTLPSRLAEVQHAYRCLSDPQARVQHDRLLAAEEQGHAQRQQRIQQRLQRYDRRHPSVASGLPWYRRWRMLIFWGVAAAFVVRVSVGLFGAEAG